jgi:hypothetical protein
MVPRDKSENLAIYSSLEPCPFDLAKEIFRMDVLKRIVVVVNLATCVHI